MRGVPASSHPAELMFTFSTPSFEPSSKWRGNCVSLMRGEHRGRERSCVMERAERGCSRLDNSGRVSPCLHGGSLAQPWRLFAGFSALVNPSTPEEQCQEPPQKRAVTCWGDTKHLHFPEGGCVLCRVPRPRGGLGITRADGEPLSTSSSDFFLTQLLLQPPPPSLTLVSVCSRGSRRTLERR